METGRVKMTIDRRDRAGWQFFPEEGGPGSAVFASYPAAKAAALAAGCEVDNAGWIHRLLMWQFNGHAIDGYPTWEIEKENSPAFVRIAHERGTGHVESHELAAAWDDVAEVDFYQRDWTSDGIPSVARGDTYWSGWWFATIAERDRFVAWYDARGRSEIGDLTDEELASEAEACDEGCTCEVYRMVREIRRHRAAVRRLRDNSERAPDVRDVPMRLVHQADYDAIVGGCR